MTKSIPFPAAHPDHGRGGARFSQLQRVLSGNDRYQVVAFTATQIPDIEGRLYRPSWQASCILRVFRSTPRPTWTG